jgi:hypothetical protein
MQPLASMSNYSALDPLGGTDHLAVRDRRSSRAKRTLLPICASFSTGRWYVRLARN